MWKGSFRLFPYSESESAKHLAIELVWYDYLLISAMSCDVVGALPIQKTCSAERKALFPPVQWLSKEARLMSEGERDAQWGNVLKGSHETKPILWCLQINNSYNAHNVPQRG